MVSDGTFREDLLYRINLIPINIPSLRDRCEDIPLLVSYFADKASEKYQVEKRQTTTQAMEYLQRLSYSGNIRELKNLVERAVIMSSGRDLELSDFQSQYNNKSTSSELTLECIEKEDREGVE